MEIKKMSYARGHHNDDNNDDNELQNHVGVQGVKM